MTSIAPPPFAPVAQESLDAALRRRARRVIPGGLWGHMNAARLPEG
jgi:glutamate-1-semialdehyde 2,1-aminomutase